MGKKINSIRGMHDLVPDEIWKWHYVEAVYLDVLNSFAFQEIRFPLLEETALFKRSVGEVTDIVEKEMYTFKDRNDLSVTLRPEGTACCVRAAEQHGLLYNQSPKFFYAGPMFRYERPQKGRTRQFHQLGVEAFGMSGIDIELEVILLSASLFDAYDVLENVTLEINSIGDSEARKAFGVALKSYLESCKEKLDPDSQSRLESNPLRILDSKHPETQALLLDAPKLADFLSEASVNRYKDLKAGLIEMGIAFRENDALVRGLDYYNDLVFEWTSQDLGAQGTVCAGGRYDSLVETLGGRSTPAVGFAMGLERLVLLLETLQKLPAPEQDCDVFVMPLCTEAVVSGHQLAQIVRTLPRMNCVFVNAGLGSLKSQLKKADKSGARIGLILGEQEVQNSEVQVKFLREDQTDDFVKSEELANYLMSYFKAE